MDATPAQDSDSSDSDATPVWKNDSALVQLPYHTYCTLTITTPAARKCVEAYRKLLCFFFSNLLETDPEAVLIEYKSDPKDDVNFKNLELPAEKTIKTPNNLPKSIT